MPMRRRTALVALASVAMVIGSGPALAGTAYQVAIDVPGSVARGTVVVRARASGGVGDARYAAYQVGSGGAWVAMDRVDDGVFEARRSPWATASLPNGTYRMEVRIWGDVPPYDPADPNSFAKRSLSVAVDNAPATPGGVTASPAGSSVRLGWHRDPTSNRSDFAGYRVLGRKSASCAGTAGYTTVAETSAAALSTSAAPGGIYCYRVVALRTSDVSGVIPSAPSPAVRVVVPRAAGGSTAAGGDPGFVTGPSRGGAAQPPPPPALGRGTLKVSDAPFGERLPYGNRTITQEVEAGSADLGAASREAGPDPRRTPTLVAAGLILAVAALLLRRFLAAAPGR